MSDWNRKRSKIPELQLTRICLRYGNGIGVEKDDYLKYKRTTRKDI